MQSENKICQNCKNGFIVRPDDFSFYKKINVPSPTFCPECRMIRRMLWRNVRSLYKRNCGLCNKSLISMYGQMSNAPVYCRECWNGDVWSPFVYGKEYDFSKNFFVQLKELFNIVPRFYAYHTRSLIRSEFTNFSGDNKDCYLAYSIIDCENILYSEVIDKSKNSMDCYSVQKIDNCSYNIDCEGNYNSHYAIESRSCIDSYFIYDCVNCSNCCLSSNLRNQSYVFKNVKLSKEEYQKAFSELELGKYKGFKKAKDSFDQMLKTETIHRFSQIYNSQNVIGDYIGNSKNVFKSFDVQNSENVAYSVRVLDNTKDSYDLQGVASGELIYESMASSFKTYKNFFCYITLESRECEYSLILKNCSNCFGCVGLTNAKFCIFNKQYSEKEYFEIVDKIKKQMDEMPYIDKKERVFKYGEFFPYDMSPFGYNETNAHDFFNIKKEEAIAKGYPWKDKEKINYQTTVNSSDLPDDVNDTNEDILKEIINCPNNGDQDFQCTSAYRIVPDELQFYKQKNLPLPRFCPNCRHYDRLKYRNPIKLYNRGCMNENCKNVFETTYSPDRPAKIYCEKCYQQKVY